MENVGFEPNTVHGTIHGPGYSGSGGIGAGLQRPEVRRRLPHVRHRLVAQPDQVVGRRQRLPDPHAGRPRTATSWVFDHPFFIILNLAVGGYWPGDPDGSTSFPQQLVVDYVHVTTG